MDKNAPRAPRHRQEGFTLIEALLVIAVIATLAMVTVAKVSDVIHRNENSNALAREQAVYQAETQYTIAHGGVPDTYQFSFTDIQPWLVINGNPIQTEADLMANTGNRTMNYGTPATGPSVSPAIDPQYLPGSATATTTTTTPTGGS
jgi:prepilin-type N-terminal cleavage/methylation domain-containing protein